MHFSTTDDGLYLFTIWTWGNLESWFPVTQERKEEGVRRRKRSSHTADGLSDPSKQKSINWCFFLYLRAALMMKLGLYHPEKLINNVSFSHWVSEERSFHPHPPESHPAKDGPLNCLVFLLFLSAETIFGSPAWQTEMHREEREEEWWERERERSSHNSPGRQCVRSGALGPFGWLKLNGCPGEVTRLIENRLRGEGNAFALHLAPWPTVQRLPWQLWNPTYLFAKVWRERAERLSE